MQHSKILYEPIARPTRSSDIDDEERALRIELAAAYRLAAYYGWEDQISTHFSVRSPSNPKHFLINPYGTLFEEVTASSLIKIDLEGNVVSPTDVHVRVNKAGFIIHSAIHEARSDAHCVMHCHTLAGIAVGVHDRGLLLLDGHSLLVHEVGYHSYEGVVIDAGEQPRLLNDLGSRNALILRNHGSLTVGETIPSAFARMYNLEYACRVQMASLSAASSCIELSHGFAARVQSQIKENFNDLAELTWGALRRMLDRRDSSYRD